MCKQMALRFYTNISSCSRVINEILLSPEGIVPTALPTEDHLSIFFVNATKITESEFFLFTYVVTGDVRLRKFIIFFN